MDISSIGRYSYIDNNNNRDFIDASYRLYPVFA